MIYFDSGWKLSQIKKHLKFHINNQYKLTTTNITRRPSKAKKLSKLHTTKPQPTKIRITTKLYLLQHKQLLLTWRAKDFLPSLKFIKRHEKQTSLLKETTFTNLRHITPASFRASSFPGPHQIHDPRERLLEGLEKTGHTTNGKNLLALPKCQNNKKFPIHYSEQFPVYLNSRTVFDIITQFQFLWQITR